MSCGHPNTVDTFFDLANIVSELKFFPFSSPLFLSQDVSGGFYYKWLELLNTAE